MYMTHNDHMTRGSCVPSSVVKNVVVLMHNDSEYLKGLMRSTVPLPQALVGV